MNCRDGGDLLNDTKSTSSEPEEGQILSPNDIPSDPEPLPSSESLALDVGVVPLSRPKSISELMGPDEHVRHCPCFTQPSQLKSLESTGTICSPSTDCTCGDLEKVIVYPEHALLEMDPQTERQSAKEATEGMDVIGLQPNEYVTRRAIYRRAQQHANRALLRAGSDMESNAGLPAPINVDWKENRIGDSKDG